MTGLSEVSPLPKCSEAEMESRLRNFLQVWNVSETLALPKGGGTEWKDQTIYWTIPVFQCQFSFVGLINKIIRRIKHLKMLAKANPEIYFYSKGNVMLSTKHGWIASRSFTIGIAVLEAEKSLYTNLLNYTH